MNFLRQSTAVDIAIGPFIDDDGITPATGLSITQAETRLKKNNGAWGQANDNTTATHEEEGWYEKELDATDTNTCGILIVAVYISGNLAYWKEFQVVEEAVYDMFFAASATGIIGTAQTGDSFARLGAPAGASVSADVAAVKVDTAAILVDTGTTLDARIPAALVNGRMDSTIDGTGMEAGAVTAVQSGLATAAELAKVPKSDGTATWNATALASINAEADTALADYDAPTKAELDSGLDALPTAAENADAVWDEAIAGHAGAGSTGEALSDAGAAGTPPTAAEVADAVWDEAQADHVGAGSFGEVATEVASILVDTAEIGAAGAGLTALATQASVNTIDDLLDTEIPALTTAVADLPTNAELATALGTADDAVLSAVATVDTVVDAIKVQTDKLTFTVANQLDVNIQSINDVTITGDGQVGTEFGV